MIEYDSKYVLEHFYSVCRFCLSEDNCEDIIRNGMVNECLEKAIDFIVSKVDESDGLPNKICRKCLTCVIEFAELEARCQEVYEVLQQVSDQAINSQNCEEISIENAIVEDTKSIQGLDTIADNDEPPEDTYINAEKLIESAIIEESTASQHSEDTLYLTENNLIESPCTEEQSVMKAQTRKKGKNCPICGKFVSQLSKHLPMHSDVKRHACSFCNKQFAHDTTLRKHINSVHLKLKRYQCQHCQESFTDPSSLRYHNVTKHQDTKNFTCSICNKSYYTSTGLQQHNSLNHEQRKFKCEECGKMFAMKYHLKEHEKTHSDVRPYACSLCDRTFKRSKNLNEHLAVHEGKV
ncbi:zinc finger protein 28 [Aedes aegypti]|uniref:Uncharacterized protein n=1 Tax=Aedes aegypti TaxID=7159 RepID=A0A1S4F4R6_AEDAE|nr:zinc finger protein 28 [Aedes aegypti]